MKFPLSLPLLLASLLAASLVGQQPVPFRVGTWNLEFLGAAGNFRNNLPPRTDADHAAIGRKVAELGVAVLAVQEVNDEATLRKVAAGAGRSWDLLLGTSGTWDDGKTAQRIGFLWDKAQVDLLFAEELLQLPREFEGQPIFHRVPVTAAFKHKASGCDFRLVTVHLKAGRKAQDEQKRRGEVQALVAWLDEGRTFLSEDPDVLVLGDFNSTYGSEPEQLFEQGRRWRYLDQATPTPTILHFPEPIDQVVVGHRFQEVRPESLAIDSDCDGMAKETWRQTYSDHFPVTVAIAASADDDPDATFRRGGPEQALPRPTGPAPSRPGAPGEATWPPKVGQQVSVLLVGSGAISGRLVAPVPDGPGGWVVVEIKGQVRAFPLAQVASLQF